MGGDHFLNLQPGTIVNGRYEVVKCLGTGSMGMVYACRHRELSGHIVAMKVLFSEVARDEVAAARFRNEIVSSYEVSHPNVVRAYEYFRDGDLLAFTMEYIGGGDLADKINTEDEIPISEIIRMLCQMCSGVQAIHDAGIVHRDLKPENILITGQGDIKITDFGIARLGTGQKLTEHGGVVGTIDYVSPEYLEEGQVDARSDIYALGVLAYEMITHQPPFKGKSVIETMTMRLRSDPEAPHHLRPDCPIALSNIVLKALARDPELRYQAAGVILEDLRAIGKPSAVPPRLPSPAIENGRGRQRDIEDIPSIGMHMPGGNAYRMSYSGSGYSGAVQEHEKSPGLAIPDAGYDGGSDFDGASLFSDNGYESNHIENGVGTARTADWDYLSRYPDEPQPPSVAISQGHLSTERMKELALDLYQPRGGVFRTVVSWTMIFLFGFCVGLFLLWQFKPELFGYASRGTMPGFPTTIDS